MMAYHKTVQKIKDILDQSDIWYECFEHGPVKTSEEASKIRSGYTLKQGAKAIIIRVKDLSGKHFVMLVVPGDQKFSNEKVKNVLVAKDIRFATEDEILEITDGIQIGGVPPFGNLFNIKVVVDSSLFNNEKIIFNAGDRCFSIAIKSKDYQNIVNPIIKNII